MAEPPTPGPSPEDEPSQHQAALREALRTPTATRPPILASDALREDLAPIEPARVSLRWWLVAIMLGMIGSGGALSAGLVAGPVEAKHVAFLVAAVVLVALGMPYRVRGILVASAGVLTIGLGLAGRGPLTTLVGQQSLVGVELARALAATALPAALLFRAHYRAYRGARIALIIGLVLAVPATVHEALVVASGPPVAQATAALAIVSVLASFMGFMGSGTTGASTAWAVALVVTFGSDVMVRALWMEGGPGANVAQLHAGLVLMMACALVVIGLFMWLASTFAHDARRGDILAAIIQAKSDPGSDTPD